MQAGSRDLERAAEALASRLPEPLGVYARLAYNYRWAWDPDGPDVFRDLDPERWEKVAENPVKQLQEASTAGLSAAAQNPELLARVAAVEERVNADLNRPPHDGPASTERPIAYFSAEYGFHGSFPIYSGGLGALAGDILKEASDRAWPLVAVGLLYRHGYFRQRIDNRGWQHEYWVDTDPDRLPAALVTDDAGKPITICVHIGTEEVVAQIWRTNVGRVPLYLLDAERPENNESARWITSRLYIGDEDTRLAQYMLLGIGGVRALEAMAIEPSIVHLNEGHAAFASLELAKREYSGQGSLGPALDVARQRTVFTTHTPVPAGNDTYPAHQVESVLEHMAGTLGVNASEVIRLGRTNPEEEAEPFGVTQFALRTSRAANGVARRHGEVAREMWNAMWPDKAVDDVPITHVTNGVHIPTWLGRPMWALLNQHLGEDWLDRATDPATWAPVEDIPAQELWAVRTQQRAELIEYVRHRAVVDRLARDESRPYAEAAAAFDPDVLTVGFARRLATYKRLNLLLQDVERAIRVVGSDRPIQVLLAGKAHPRDDAGKSLVQGLFSMKHAPGFAGRVAYLDDYDLRMAAHLVRGCDVWINLPRPPLEASGTSGMKNVMNGGLQLSVLDGWWAEGYDGDNGWALPGDVDPDHGAQDARHAHELFRLLEEEVAPEFYTAGEDGIPKNWVTRIRRSLRTLGPEFGAGRMLEDYEKKVYGK
ncbi:alpha-glucan family phosphorylase [Solirubrobacter sp. CPCC 204708]|uniref:glycogen phosphorylase n=1 Tax=Solirubrobacter deserti TaxID=2282478 RepID=A0ABT4RJ20_9ACTN|nr:alpha-glucan family phosphorylase [Solirubrobacter deserti]MBE2320879.1 alpha-glucan family phosphorylase [Solirubrobacter deserti]MDA0138513.1 alpha-glucan family phosphorylase [Solirubrobacter deserti]